MKNIPLSAACVPKALVLIAVICFPPLKGARAQENPSNIVINEIHYDEKDKTVRGEFIELHNPGAGEVDLSGWFFSEGVDFTFPAGTTLPPGGFLVMAENPEVIRELYKVEALGPWAGTLKNRGESIVLRDGSGSKADEVTYGAGFPWPTVGEDPSPSIELVHPSLDNDLGGSWRASGDVQASPAMELIGREQTWRFWKGDAAPPVDPGGATWMEPGYTPLDSWLTGQTPIGFGDDDDKTVLDDMQGSYAAVLARHEFTLPDGPLPSAMELELYFDDGVVAFLNGREIARQSINAAWEPGHEAPSGTADSHEASAYEPVSLRGVQAYLRNGANVLTLIGVNSSISGSDFSLDASLRTIQPSPDELLIDPSPGRPNSVYSTNAPPQARQVTHTPIAPVSGEDVKISVKVTDPDGVASVEVAYQLVEPGDYITRTDERYATAWVSIPMQAGPDDEFTASLPGELQKHRRLVRYRVTVTDAKGARVTVPSITDPQPNFAYFVYDGVPSYTGAATRSTEPVTYTPELLNTLPVYHFITSRVNHEDALYIPDSTKRGGDTGDIYRWEGTMVHEGVVYDHIRFRARGGVWRYAMGKNMWKFDFNRGHRFQARDDYGRPYKTQWDKLNFSACIQQGDFQNRGEQGLFESTGFRLFNLAGVPASRTHFLHFRVIDREAENGENSGDNAQFDTDFQGLYLAIEQLDGKFLDEHGLPDGNLYKIEGYAGTSNNQGPTQVSNGSDVREFIRGYRSSTPTEEWWYSNLNVAGALSYHSITEAIHHYDIAYGKNYFYYNNPGTGLWQVIPWDLDLTWADNMYGDGQHEFLTLLAKRAPYNTDYQNRLREIMDLLYNPEQTGMLIDEKAAFIYQPGEPSFVDADRAVWDYNPILRSRYVNSSKAGQGLFYRVGVGGRTFAGMIQKMKNYVETRSAWLKRTYLRNENDIPKTPEISYSGADSYALDALRFTTAPFESPGGATFAGLKWRVSEVTDPSAEGFAPYGRTEPRVYEIEDAWESETLAEFVDTIEVPALKIRPGGVYRARVRHLDSEGRWSHWSDPLQFVAGDPDLSAFQAALVVSELMYNPAPPSTGAERAAAASNSEFEYLVVANIGDEALDLTNVRLTKGVDFDFAPGTILQGGSNLYVVKNLTAFKARYGDAVNAITIAGEWDRSDNLQDSGEEIRVTYGAGSVIREFAYDDKGNWPQSADGEGYSLVLKDTGQLLDPSKPENWEASATLNGTPGQFESSSGYAAWKARFGIGDDGEDGDFDGTPALIEFALGQSPRLADPSPLAVSLDGTGRFLELAFRWNTLAEGASFTILASGNLGNWESAPANRFSLVSESDLGGGVMLRRYRDSSPISEAAAAYLRLQVTIGQ